MSSVVWRWNRSALAACVIAAGCGSSPTAPTPIPNRAPVIVSLAASPSFGIQDFQTFSFSASATDADGDALTYTWVISSATATGQFVAATFTSGGIGSAALTVSDGHGGTAAGAASFIVGSMTGNWTVTSGVLAGATLSLTQNNGGIVTGTWGLVGAGTGTIDPAQPSTIAANAVVVLHLKLPTFSDFTMNGLMESSDGRTVTGTLQGSGFSGHPFSMSK